MSKLERLIETMLLKERRRLINNKTPPKHIRILRNKLLVSGQVHAQVTVINDKCQLDFVIHGEIVQTPPCANQPLPPNHSNLTNVCNPAANHLPTCTRLSKSMKSFDIKMITWNARSIKNKLTFIQSFTFTKSIRILCLTETWLLPTINNNEILPSKYEIYRRDCHSIGGGILIAISNDLPSRLVYTAHDIELIVVEILLPNPVTLICVYIPPNSPQSTTTSFILHIHNFTNSKNTLIITGDLNHPEIGWTSLSGNSFTGDAICDCFFKLNLVQLINEPTHIGGNTLNVIASTHPQLVFNVSITPPS